jgi:hypothetical protein
LTGVKARLHERKGWKRIRIVLAVVLGIFVLLVSSPFLAYAYNKYVFPLGRLARSIEIGDSYDEVHGKLANYYASKSGQPQLQFVEYESATDLTYTRAIPKATVLAIYDLSIFSEVKLSILFDEQKHVADVLFIGD